MFDPPRGALNYRVLASEWIQGVNVVERDHNEALLASILKIPRTRFSEGQPVKLFGTKSSYEWRRRPIKRMMLHAFDLIDKKPDVLLLESKTADMSNERLWQILAVLAFVGRRMKN